MMSRFLLPINDIVSNLQMSLMGVLAQWSLTQLALAGFALLAIGALLLALFINIFSPDRHQDIDHSFPGKTTNPEGTVNISL